MSATQKVPRIFRKHDGEVAFTDSTYRAKSFPLLMEDFQERCAYSMVSREDVGDQAIEVDHFNPRLTGSARHKYKNLYPACSISNRAKSDEWPDHPKAQRTGARFLDCCVETDYGCHIFENLETGELLAATPAAVYHIENCDLNNPWYVNRRRRRTERIQQLEFVKAELKKHSAFGDAKKWAQHVESLRQEIEKEIPVFPELPPGVIPF